MSRNLVERRFQEEGILYAATEHTGAFLDTLKAEYTSALRDRAIWLVNLLGVLADSQLDEFVRSNIDKWGAEFEMESVLWTEDSL